jgi:aarF domain-containing kinase
MATRPDLFSDHLCHRLSRLHTQAPMHHFAETRLMIERSFNKPLEELFEEIDQHPLASGAIAQIHKAKLKGREGYVAVKVRHPRVSESIFRDLSIIFTFSQLIDKFRTFAWLNLRENVLSFAMSMHAQTNMDLEAQSLEQFAKNFRYIPSIIFPTPIMHSKSVLIESFEEGIPITEYISDKYPQELRARIATLGTSMYLKMMFIDNFVHADLHPGNILVRLDQNNNPKLVILDTGMMTTLSAQDRKNFIDLLSAVIAGNSEEAANLMIERSRSGDLIKTDPEKVANFKREMAQLIEYVMDRPLADLGVGRILQRALSIGRKYHVILEPNFTTLVIGTIIIEGLGRRLNPNFNFIEAAKPYLSHERTVRKAYSTRYMKRINFDKLSNWFSWKQ